MDIHKPKPWHSFREFLKEYAIIVVGVLTALAAEQGVEWLHWRHLAEQTEHDLAAGLGPDLVNAASLVAIVPCQDTRRRALAQALESEDARWRANPQPRAGTYRDPRAIPWVIAQPGPVWSHAPWEAALTSGVLSHMPRGRVQDYADAYRLVDIIRERQGVVNADIPRLAGLAIDRTLTEAQRSDYLERLSLVEHNQTAMAALSRQTLADAHRLGVEPDRAKLQASIDDDRRALGGCVVDPKAPTN